MSWMMTQFPNLPLKTDRHGIWTSVPGDGIKTELRWINPEGTNELERVFSSDDLANKSHVCVRVPVRPQTERDCLILEIRGPESQFYARGSIGDLLIDFSTTGINGPFDLWVTSKSQSAIDIGRPEFVTLFITAEETPEAS